MGFIGAGKQGRGWFRGCGGREGVELEPLLVKVEVGCGFRGLRLDWMGGASGRGGQSNNGWGSATAGYPDSASQFLGWGEVSCVKGGGDG